MNHSSNQSELPTRNLLTLACRLSFIAAPLALLLSLSCGMASRHQEEESLAGKPNIIIVVADDAGWADVGYHGSEIRTPHLDKLAQEGVELDQFYAYPICSPTRASLLTGRPASRSGILGAIAMRSTQALPKESPTLAEVLREQGYETSITGKWHLGLSAEVGPSHYGFEHTYGYLHGQIDPYTHLYKNGDRSWHRNGEFIREEGHATDLIAEEAVTFIRQTRDPSRPFFLYVAFSVPHYPLAEDEKWVEPYRGVIENESRRLFAASMTHMDDAIGRIIATLDSEGLRQETLLLFFSDNGGQGEWTPTFEYDGKFAANDRLGGNEPLRGWKGSLFEGGIRVPAVLSWPGHLGPSTVREPMIVYDLLPTLANLAGAPEPPGATWEGVNVWPLIAGVECAGERTFYWRTNRQLAVRVGDWKLMHDGPTPDEGSQQLFNLRLDPTEKNDRAEEDVEVSHRLEKILREEFELDPDNLQQQ